MGKGKRKKGLVLLKDDLGCSDKKAKGLEKNRIIQKLSCAMNGTCKKSNEGVTLH